ncbi:MAG: BatD family protein [Pirellulaceae bacterium]
MKRYCPLIHCCATPLGRIVLCVVIFCCRAVVAPGADELETKVVAAAGPYFVGLPVAVQVTAAGVSDRQEPEITVIADDDEGEERDDLRWNLIAKNPTYMRFNNNGRIVSQSKYDFVFRFTAKKAGTLKIGPFEITDGSYKQRVDPIELTFEEVPTTENMRIFLRLPDGPYFPDQRVPVEIEWWYAGELSNTSVSISSDLFDTFTFEDEQPSKVRQALLPIDTEDGSVDLQATVREEARDGKRFRVFTARRTMIPDRIGTYSIDPIEVVIRRQIVGQRRSSDSFGFGIFDQVETYVKGIEAFRALGEPLKITIGGFPDDGKPASFIGAVGQGFSIDVAADRTVVRVGDPIRLNIRLRGDGNLQNARLPSLSADGGLDPQDFRLPEGDVAGELGEGEKSFSVSVRVENESVSEIPSIAYSWFDTDAKEYRTTRSDPIALRVMPAQVTGADDVVSAAANPTKSTPSLNQEMSPTKPSGPSDRAMSMLLNDAELAIQTDPSLLLRATGKGASSMTVQTVSYAVGVAMIVLAWVDNRRSRQDPLVKQDQKLIKQQQALIADAASKPKKQGASQIASALRVLLTIDGDDCRDETESLISRCDAIAYQPLEQQGDAIPSDIVQQASDLANLFLDRKTSERK